MKIIRLDSIDSTNSEALRRLQDFEDMTVLWALEQTAGRGQRGNSWFSAPGENLTFSVVLKRPVKAADAHFLNYAIAEAVADYLNSQGVLASVKWPNDIYVGKNKISGILIENSLVGDSLAASVVGVGFNVNQKEFPQLANATSLTRCTGKVHDLEECLNAIVSRFEMNLSCLESHQTRAQLLSSYSSHLFRKGQTCRYRDMASGEEFWGRIEGVDPEDGRLLISNLDSNKTVLYRFKEVSYIL